MRYHLWYWPNTQYKSCLYLDCRIYQYFSLVKCQCFCLSNPRCSDLATPGCWLISDTDTKFRLADLSDSELMTGTVAESVRPLAGTFTYLMGQSYAMISFVSTRSMQLWFIVPAKWTACLGCATSQIIILIYFLLHTDQTARRLLCKTLQWKWNKSHLS